MDIGKKIQENRLKKGWTQEHLGTLLNVSRTTISSWEVGRNYPDINTIIKLSHIFNLSLDQLLLEDTNMIKSINYGVQEKKKFKFILFVLTIILFTTILFLYKNRSNSTEIYYVTEETKQGSDIQPFNKSDIQSIDIKDNIININFTADSNNSFYNYYVDGGGGEATIALYKKSNSDVDPNPVAFDGHIKIDLTSLPKIKKLIILTQ